MKYLVKDISGKTVLVTVIEKNALARLKENPAYKLLVIPEER